LMLTKFLIFIKIFHSLNLFIILLYCQLIQLKENFKTDVKRIKKTKRK